MSSRLNELEKQLFREVGKAVARYGFEPKPSGQTFYRKESSGWAAFHLSFIPHEDVDFDVTADVAVRIDEVENLVNEDNKLLSKSEKVQTATLGVELGNIESGQPMRWKVATDADVKIVATGLAGALARIGMPYIKKHSSLEQAFAVLSTNEPSAWLHSPVHGGRCQRAIALVFVLGRYDQLHNLIEQSELFLKSKNDFGLRSFQKFAEKLRARLQQ